MLQFWSTWNFLWFVGSELNIIQRSNALKTSIIITSVLGGFMVYVYPRRLLIKTGEIVYDVPYNVMVITDILFHQFPFVSTFLFNNPEKLTTGCGRDILYPFLGWGFYNCTINTNMNKLYGIRMKNLITWSMTIAGGYGLCHHVFKKRLT